MQASGSRWIGHKWGAMKHIVSKYGAYTSHLASLTEDSTVKPADRCKLKGYYKQWINTSICWAVRFFVIFLVLVWHFLKSCSMMIRYSPGTYHCAADCEID